MCRKLLTYDIVHLGIAQGRHRGWQLAREQATKHKMYTYAKYVEIMKKVLGLPKRNVVHVIECDIKNPITTITVRGVTLVLLAMFIRTSEQNGCNSP